MSEPMLSSYPQSVHEGHTPWFGGREPRSAPERLPFDGPDAISADLRESDMTLRAQVVAQIELAIQSGDLRLGDRLPSIRAQARRLGAHPRSIYTAYRQLADDGVLSVRRGSGTFVSRGLTRPGNRPDCTLLEWVWEGTLRGLNAREMNTAFERLTALPILVVDPCLETAELLRAELATRVATTIEATSFAVLARSPDRAAKSLCVTLALHGERLHKVAPAAGHVAIPVAAPWSDPQLVRGIPEGGLAVVISHSPDVLRYAQIMLRKLRGADVEVETGLLSRRDEWQGAAAIADRVFCDILSAPLLPRAVRDARIFRLTGDAPVRGGPPARVDA